MKRNLVLGLNILTFFMIAVPLLIFMCTSIGVVSYLAFNKFDPAVSRATRSARPVRIRTIPSLKLVTPEPVTNEPVAPAEPQAEPARPEPVLPGGADQPEPSASPVSAEATVITIVTASPEAISPAAALPDSAASSEPAAASPVVPGPDLADQNETPTPAVVEVPLEPAPAQPPAPQIVAKPEPTRVVPSEPSFVPDSSFFDQLLDRVK